MPRRKVETGGRPRKRAQERRDVVKALRFTQEEYDGLEALADAAGPLEFATWARIELVKLLRKGRGADGRD